MSRPPLTALLVLLLAGCASGPAVRPPPPSAAGGTAAAVLMVELALARGDADSAHAAAARLGESSTDPHTLARAVEVLAGTGDATGARAAVARWLELEPGALAAVRWDLELALAARDLAAAGPAAMRMRELAGSELLVASLRGVEPPQRAMLVLAPLAAHFADDAVLAYGAAWVAERAQHLERAAAHVARALALRPGWSAALLLEARIGLRQGGGRAALAALEAARAADPASAGLAVQTASLLAEAGARAAARAVLDDYLGRVPGDLDARYARALLLAQGDDPAAAAREFRALRDQGVRPDEVPYWLGLIAERTGDELGALEHFRRVGEAGPLLDAVLRGAHIVARRAGTTQAREFIATARATYPMLGAGLAAGEARLLLARGDAAAARALVERARGSWPADEELVQLAATLAIEAGDLVQGEALLRGLLAARPDDPARLNALGYTLADAGVRLDEARRLLDAALAGAPDDPAITDSAGWVRFRQGDYAAARVLLEQAWARLPDPEIGAHLGEVLWTMGERSAAVQVWDAARALDAHHAVLAETRARLEP